MKQLKFITHDNTDAYFNLASEEYLLKQTDGYYIYLWINSPAVIVGVNQNAIEEVNLSFTEDNGIKVVRRLTGGGAVYHDEGNLCYTVIAPFNPNINHYKEFTAPVIEYLNSLGVKAEFTGRNDITVDGKKISGNAQTVYKNRIMHHGTLLFDTDTEVLGKALKPSPLKMLSKGIKSARARVVNIKECLPVKMSIQEFKNGLKETFRKQCEEYSFSETDIKNIEKLVSEKYSKYEWNVGYSPKGENRFEFKFGFGIFTFAFDTLNGVIENADIRGDFFTLKDISEFAKQLNGKKFVRAQLESLFSKIGNYIVGADGQEILSKMFD